MPQVELVYEEAPEVDLLALVTATLEDAKAEDVVTIGLEGKSTIGDHMVIASGRSERHVNAIADRLIRKLKERGFGRAHVEGLAECSWVLIDAGDVIIHIFRPDIRAFYNLEKMWSSPRPDEVETLARD